jgi:adenine phosphoribosyltransferase
MTPAKVRQLIREVADYPKAGVNYLDITPLLADADGFSCAIDLMTEPWRHQGVTHVVGIEARGFVLAAPVALGLEAGVVPARKAGKLPRDTHSADYQLEYGAASLEVHIDAVPSNGKVLVVDDVLATGGTLAATIGLIEKLDCDVVGVAVLLEIAGLKGREALGRTPLTVALP